MLNWWRQHFLGAELGLTVVLTAAVLFWGFGDSGSRSIESLMAGNRKAIYQVLASIWGALLGFVIATLSIVLVASQAARMAIVRRSKFYPDLWRTFVSTIRILGLATATSVIALLVDRDPPLGSPSRIAFTVWVFFSLLAVLRLARSVWILENVVKIVGRPNADSADAEGPRPTS